jgi:hypothetical protein
MAKKMKKPKPKKAVPKKRVFRRLPRHDRTAIIEECAKCVPTNWCDALLTGPGAGPFADGRKVEALLRGVQDRIRALSNGERDHG